MFDMYNCCCFVYMYSNFMSLFHVFFVDWFRNSRWCYCYRWFLKFIILVTSQSPIKTDASLDPPTCTRKVGSNNPIISGVC